MNKTIKELFNEWDALRIESIGFQRAGIDNIKFDYERDRFVFNRIKEIESELFPVLEPRVILTFDKTPREEYWRQCDALKWDGFIMVENKSKGDQFNESTITGKVTFAKKPHG